MTEDATTIARILAVRTIRLRAVLSGVVLGLMLGAGLLLATGWLVLKGGPVVGPHLALLGQFYPGYTVSPTGCLIGFVYGFASGFLLGWSVAALYNRVVDLLDKSRPGPK